MGSMESRENFLSESGWDDNAIFEHNDAVNGMEVVFVLVIFA